MTVTPYQRQPPSTAAAYYPLAPVPNEPPNPSGGDVDSWTQVLAATAELAQKIADTDFVPAAMRGNPAAVTAAMLTGRELGVGPMTALAHIHIVKGKPGQSAQLMRQLVYAAGHSIRYVESTDSRCIVEGRRRGEDKWERVAFTADQAKRAGIQLGGYPEDKLVARATARLCRRKFADCLGGMPYTIEELADENLDENEVAASAAASKPAKTRTARRRTPTTRTHQPEPAPEPEPTEDTSPQPPLPGEEDDDQQAAEAPDTDQGSETPTTAQNRKMHALFHDADIGDRGERLRLTSLILGRDIATSAELTRTEASNLIDQLEQWSHDGHLADHAAAVLHGDQTEEPTT